MSDVEKSVGKAILLWLSGMRLVDVRTLPAIAALLERGALVELDTAPIASPPAEHYRVLSGKAPSASGYFDTLVARNYTVVEETAGRGPTPPLLPDLLRGAGWAVRYEETSPSELVSRVQTLTSSVTEGCLIVKCVVDEPLEEALLTQVLQNADSWRGEDGLLALLSDTQPAAVKRFVNINNFLTEMGIMEWDEQRGQIDWANSLAFFAGHGQLMVNLLGRDPRGAVHPQDEYDEVRESLVKALPIKLRDPESGEPVIEQIYRKEDLYAGDYLFCAPDLVVVFQPGYAPSPRSTRCELDDTIFTTPAAGEVTFSGVNPSMLGGFLLAAAPALAARVIEYQRAPLTAVTPTLLHALGVEYGDMDSPAIDTLFTYEYLETHPIRSSSRNEVLSAEDEELIIGHLRDLGYV